MKRYDAVNTNGDPMYAPSPDGEMVFYSDVAQWVKLGNGPEESCNVWANHMGIVRIIDFYRCPEYGNAFWSYDGEDIDDIDFTHYMVIKQPLPPSEASQ